MKQFILIALILSTVAFAGKKETTDSLISEAKIFLEANDYDAIDAMGKEFLKEFGKDGSTKEMVPIILEAKIQLQQSRDFDKLFKTYIKKYPDSDKLSRLYYLEAISNARRKEYYSAILSCSNGLKNVENNESSKNRIIRNGEKIAKSFLSLSELTALNSENLTPPLDETIAYYQAIRAKDENHEMGAELLAKFSENYPSSTYDTTAVLVESAITKTSTSKRIALLAPLTGQSSALGQIALSSAKIAINDYKTRTGEEVELVVVDTKGNSIETANRVRDLISSDFNAIVGPILSNTATVAAAMLVDHPEITLITPTATDDGIAALGKNIFQINLTSKAVADKIARYAVKTLAIKEFASIVPISDYGKTMNRYFTETVEDLGGVVVITEYYSTEDTDHREQFDKIREHQMEKRWGSTDSVYQLSQEEQEERIKFLEDSTIQIGGLFIPAKAENIMQLAAEVPFYNIRTQLLGANGWDNNTLIIDGSKNVNNAIFSTGFKGNKNDSTWVNFSKNYSTLTGANPSGVVAPLVYDAFTIMIKSLDGSSAPERLRMISSTVDFVGLSGTLSLNNSAGVNSGAVVKKISNGRFIRVE